MQKERALMFLKLAVNYFQLVENVANEIIKQGNKFIIMSKHELTPDEREEKTKWNDYKIVEPFFFNYYHGVELMLKGFLLSQSVDVIKHNHKIEKLYKEFCKYFPNHNIIIGILNKYLGLNIKLVEPLNTFFTKNNISVDNYYIALKYPESHNTIIKYDYDSLKFKGGKAIEFYKQLSQDISSMMKESVSFGRNNLS